MRGVISQGPTAWVVIGEIFQLPIRSKGIALSTASNWFWNCIIGVITPFVVDADKGALGVKVFFVWGTTCAFCALFAWYFVPETKGLTLEQVCVLPPHGGTLLTDGCIFQVDQMMDEVPAYESKNWRPNDTFSEHFDSVKSRPSTSEEVHLAMTPQSFIEMHR